MHSHVLVVWLLVATASVSAQDPASPKQEVRDVAVVSGRVERIDPFTRSVILKTSDGQSHSVLVGRELKTFDKLKPGNAELKACFGGVWQAQHGLAALSAPPSGPM